MEIDINQKKKYPEKLYKYQKYNEETLENLIKQQLIFSNPNSFNDPYDCRMPINFDTSAQGWERFYKHYEQGLTKDKSYLTNGKPNENFKRDITEEAEKTLWGIGSKHGVACFSDKNSENSI